jgi:hypothetical protein
MRSGNADLGQGRDEPVAFPRDSLHIDGVFRVVFQNLADFPDRRIDAVVGIQVDILAPDPADDFLSGDQLSFAFYKQEQDLHGDSLQLQSLPERRSS